MLISDLCDYSDAYVVAKGRTSVTGTNIANKRNKKLTLKNNAPFRSHISKINNIFVDNPEDFDIFILMYNLLEYNHNYSMSSGSLWNCYRNEVYDDANENNAVGSYRINNNKTTTSKCFEYKTKLIGNTPDNNSRLEVEFVVPLKCLGNFWRLIRA